MQCMQCMMDAHKQCARSMMHDPHIHTFTNRIMIANSRLGVCVMALWVAPYTVMGWWGMWGMLGNVSPYMLIWKTSIGPIKSSLKLKKPTWADGRSMRPSLTIYKLVWHRQVGICDTSQCGICHAIVTHELKLIGRHWTIKCLETILENCAIEHSSRHAKADMLMCLPMQLLT